MNKHDPSPETSDSESASDSASDSASGSESDSADPMHNMLSAESMAYARNVPVGQFIPSKHWQVDSAVMIVGKRRTGKTTCLDNVLGDNIWQYYPGGVWVCSETAHNGFWTQHTRADRIRDHLDWDMIRADIIAPNQESRLERADTGQITAVPYKLLILDDVISDNEIRTNTLMFELFFQGRHNDVCLVICTQDICGIPPKMRQNTDLIFVLAQTEERQLDVIRREFCPMGFKVRGTSPLMTFAYFLQLWTKDHQVLVIDQSKPGNRAGVGQFYSYQPKLEVAPYRCGDYGFWKDSPTTWEEQMERYANIKKTSLSGAPDDPKLRALVEEHWRQSAYNERMKAERDTRVGFRIPEGIYTERERRETRKKLHAESAEVFLKDVFTHIYHR